MAKSPILKMDLKTAAEQHKCPICTSDLPLGSNDNIIFCSVSCKNKFHNHKQGPGGQTIKRITKILNTNRRVLQEMLGEKTTLTTTMPKLVAKGFDDAYLTHIKESGGSKYYFTFDFGYRDDGNSKIKLVKAFDRE